MTQASDQQTPEDARTPPGRATMLDIVVSLFTATGFALAQPLFDLLDDSAEFFLVRRSPGSDLILLVLAISIAIPLVLAGVTLLVRLVSRGAGTAVHLALLASLGAVFLLPILRRIGPVDTGPGIVMILLAFGGGALLAYGYHRVGGLRIFMRFGAIPAAVFGIMFIFASGVSSILFPAPVVTTADAGPARSPAPVVFIMFDEFPLASLLNERDRVDTSRYPALARLARDGDWYRNALTVHDFTTWAVPAILTGDVPEPGWRAASLSNYPNNLFTLLGDGYEVRSFESVTQLCPERICEATPTAPRPADPTFEQRWAGLVRDLKIVMGHVYLPEQYRRTLPPIDETVGNFGAAPTSSPPTDPSPGGDAPANERRPSHDELVADRDGLMRAFLEAIEPTDQPPLFFIHVFVPHRPWTFLPDGRRYEEIIPPAKQKAGWRDDPWLVAQAYQQHLLQAAYADRFVGQVLEQLDAAGMYEESLVVVTADHGISFRPGIAKVRHLTEQTAGEIASVPLFIKRPNQRRGSVVDARVESIDIMPTIAAILRTDLPWDADGRSLLEPPARSKRTRVCSEAGTCITVGPGTRALDLAVRAKLALFPANDPFALAPPGYRALLGRRSSTLEQRASPARARIDHLDAYRSVDLDASTIPVMVTGELSGVGPRRVLAIELNGRIVAVTRSYTADDGRAAFAAMLPPEALIEGRNRLRVHAVDAAPGYGLTTLTLEQRR